MPRTLCIVIVVTAMGFIPRGVAGQPGLRGGWPDRPWTYIYEASHADGDPDGTGIAGVLGAFDDLDRSWDRDNPGPGGNVPPWEGDLISALDTSGNPGGAEMMERDSLGDNESGAGGISNAETLAIFDLGLSSLAGTNRRIYFERFLTDRSVLPPGHPDFDDAGAGGPAIDFTRGLTIIARFRFFSLDLLKADEALRQRLRIADADATALQSVPPGNIEYDESPRESAFDQKGMFMVTRRDVYAGIDGLLGPGGIYFGVAEDGDDSWDPANQRQPPAAAAQVAVRIAYVLGGPNDENRAFQGSGDSRIIDQLKARGARVTVLDDGATGHQTYESTDPTYAGASGISAVAHDHDLILISSTVGSNNVGNEFSYRGLGVPFIAWESGLIAKGYAWMTDPNQNGFVVGEAPTSRTMALEVVDDAHPITEGLGIGVQDFFYTPQRISASTDPVISTVAPGVRVLARVPAAPFAAIAGLLVADPDTGDLGDGSPAEARQVFFPLEDESFAGVNEAGHLLFHRAVEWALGDEKAALLGPMPDPPGPPPETTIPSFYINLGASLSIPAAGFAADTRVLKGTFLGDLSTPGAPALGGDTRVWTPLPSGTMSDMLSMYITIEPEPNAAPGPIPQMRVKVYLDGGKEPAIEVQNHSLDPDILPAIAATADGSGPNDGTGLGLGLWRSRQGGYLDVDYFGVLDGAVPPDAVAGLAFQRGNCNGDAAVDITDAVFALTYLFQGTAAPPCLEACKINADGLLDLSDAVFLLSFLFLGGPQPPEPFPGCGTAPAAECEREACP